MMLVVQRRSADKQKPHRRQSQADVMGGVAVVEDFVDRRVLWLRQPHDRRQPSKVRPRPVRRQT